MITINLKGQPSQAKAL